MALREKEEAQNQGLEVALEAGTGKEKNSSLELLDRTQALRFSFGLAQQ